MPLTKFNCLHTHVADLSPLQGMALVELGIATTRVTDLAPLKGMPLQKLMATNMPARDLTPLQGLPLKDLDLHGTKGVTSLEPLRMPPLKVLNLTNLPISDLSALTGKTTLQNLILNHTLATDASLAQLKSCPNLTTLNLKGTKVTQGGIDELKKALPNCQITWEKVAGEPK
jgi:Leucine-rich repeat (LRR) protein